MAITDVTDDPNFWISAFAIALGFSIAQLPDRAAGYEMAVDPVRTYGGLAKNEQGA